DELNCTAAAYPEDQGLPQLFEAQVRRDPAATAIVCGDRRVAYGELDRMAHRIAAALSRRGPRSPRPIGVFLDRSPELVAALLAVHKAGAAYVPLDPSHPRARLDYVIENAGLAALLTRSTLEEKLAGISAQTIAVDKLPPAAAGAPLPPAPAN